MPKTRILSRCLVPLLFCFSWPLAPVGAEDWPCWRGPRSDGTSLEKDLPVHWNGPENRTIAWKVEIPGRGHASPIVFGDRIFTVSCLEEGRDRILLCLDRPSGRTLWQRVVVNSPLEKMLEAADRPALQRVAGRGRRASPRSLRPGRHHDRPTGPGVRRGGGERAW